MHTYKQKNSVSQFPKTILALTFLKKCFVITARGISKDQK